VWWEGLQRVRQDKKRSTGTGPGKDLYHFERPAAAAVATHLAIELPARRSESVSIREICLGHREPAAAAVAAGRPWKATLEGEARDVLLVPPSGTIERRGTLPPRARMSLGLGALHGSADRLLVRIQVQTGASDAPATLFEQSLPGRELEKGWNDFSADLSSLGGREVSLAIVVQAEGASRDFVAAVSSPSIFDPEHVDSRPSVVLILIDTLRADHLSLYGYGRPTSPRIDAWAKKHAAIFRRAVAPSPWTLPSHFSLFTGIDAVGHVANHRSVNADVRSYPFLAQRFWEAGYRTHAVTGGGYVSPSYELARGFESFRYWKGSQRGREMSAHLARAKRIVDDGRGPFFLFFHTYEVHTPNGAREPHFTRFHGATDARVVDYRTSAGRSPEDGFIQSAEFLISKRPGFPRKPLLAADRDLPRDTYDSAIAYADELLGPFLDSLMEPPHAGRVIVALVSDHGECLDYESPIVAHGSLRLDNLLVPLLIATPDGRSRGIDVPQQVRMHDVYPTLLELAGLPLPPDIDARSLTGFLAGQDEPGREAVSYAAATNFGLGLLTAEGEKLQWRNQAWGPMGGQVVWSRVSAFEEKEAAAPDADRARELSRRLRTTYDQRAPGLRIGLSEPGAAPAEVELSSTVLTPQQVKLAGPEARPVTWVSAGRLRAEVVRDAPLRLNVEWLPAREVALDVTLRRPGCSEPARERIRVNISELVAPHTLSLTPGRCRAEAGPALLQLAWRGPLSGRHEGGRNEDLEALGYID
jgi:arylsulfatase